jgi:hypothetical protein
MQNKKSKTVQTSEFDKIEITKKNICPVCGKPYDYQLRITYLPDGTKECEHDSSRSLLYFTEREKKLAEKMRKQGKYLVKGSDGIVRICEPVRNKYEQIIERKKK